jgi:hypothetical protein
MASTPRAEVLEAGLGLARFSLDLQLLKQELAEPGLQAIQVRIHLNLAFGRLNKLSDW